MHTIAAQGVGSDNLHVMSGGPSTDNHEQGYREHEAALSLD
jgi:hypothetical protein